MDTMKNMPPAPSMLSAARRDYVSSQLGALNAGGPQLRANVGEALMASAFAALSLSEELATAHRDRWGNWDWMFSRAHRLGALYRPWLDEEILTGVDGGVRPPVWPNGAPFALCLTHDVDLVTKSPGMRAAGRDVSRAFNVPMSLAERGQLVAGGAWRLGRSLLQRTDPLWCYEKWIDLEAQLGMTSTFFFFPSSLASPHKWDASYRFDDRVRYRREHMNVQGMMQAIHAAGCEIGVHGSIASARVRGVLARERLEIERVLGSPIVSGRQHYLCYDAQTTPALWADALVRVDSTHGFNRGIGFRCGTSFPYRVWDFANDRASDTIEVPQHIMDRSLFAPDALEYNADMAISHCIQMMDAVERVGGCLTLSWHPNNLTSEKHWVTYRTLLEEARARRAWGAGTGAVAGVWRKRLAAPTSSALAVK